MIMKCLQNAHFIALKTLFQKRDRFVDQLGYGQIGGSDDVVVAAVDRKQKLLGMALSDGDCHGGRHFPKQGVCGQNAEGTDDKIRIPAGNKHGIFPGCAEVSSSLEHGSGCGCVGADGIQFTVGQLLFTEAGSHKTADSAALAVNYYDFHKSSI